ncbi:hypothetical protein FHS16_005993 [Paenibacillus endophyticus]|uniref:Uncharacterized protein n=1 Tax=Paenibacillus endophyticus TaxID=1294268 RepID=A0A7W5GE81_9BACL|nr:hypothetical protein [Paenibacillus endophyticus]
MSILLNQNMPTVLMACVIFAADRLYVPYMEHTR